jgi:lipopolysaccharide exporter
MTEDNHSLIKNKTSFAGDTLRLVSGTVITQVIGVVFTPILARFFAPETFGNLAIFISMTSIITVLICMRYELSILLPDNDQDAANLLVVSLCFVFLVTLVSGAIIYLYRDWILSLLKIQDIKPYLLLVPISGLFNGVTLALSYWSSRTKHYSNLSLSRVSNTASTTLLKLSFGVAGIATTSVKIYSTVIGQCIAALVLLLRIWKDDRRFIIASINYRLMIDGVKRYKKLPLISTWSDLLNTISLQLPVFLLSNFFSTTVVGYYAIGYQLIKIPTTLISTAVGQVFYQRSSEAKSNGTLRIVVENTFSRLIMLGIFPLMVIAVIGSEIFVLFFGANWQTAGEYAQILAPWIFFVFVGSPISSLINTLDLQGIGLLFNILMIGSRAGSLIYGGFLNNVYISLSLFSLTGVVLWVCLCAYLLNAVGISPKNTAKILGTELGILSPFIIILLIMKLSLPGWLVVLLSGLLIVPYYAICLYRDRVSRDRVISFILQIQTLNKLFGPVIKKFTST